MATSKFYVFLMFSILILFKITADSSRQEDLEVSDSFFGIELERLKARVSFLESIIDERNLQLRSKDEIISQMDTTILEKLDSIISSLTKMSLQKKELLGGKQDGVAEQEEQMNRLVKEIQAQNKIKEDMEVLTSVGEKKVNVQKARLEEASSVSEESMKEQERSILHVIALQLNNFQSYMLSCWKNQGISAWNLAAKTVSEKAYIVQQHAQMLITTVVMEWMPTMKKQFVVFASHIEPDGKFFILKTIDAYYEIKSFAVSLIVRTQREVSPFVQEAQKFAEPHVNHIAMLARPYLDEAYITLQPYIRKTEFAYRKLVDSASLYHMQMQEMLKTNQFTRSLATVELASFVATLVLCLPVIILLRMYSTFFTQDSASS